MSAATLQPSRKRFTRAEAAQMHDSGLFAGQRFELIDEDLIDKTGQNPPHACAIRTLFAWLIQIFGAKQVQIQQPIEAGAVSAGGMQIPVSELLP
jgi:hypothetical protein